MSKGKIDVLAFGVAMSGALVSAFVACNIIAALYPGLRFPCCWVGLFTSKSPGSHASFTEGIIATILMSWFITGFFAIAYNNLTRRVS